MFISRIRISWPYEFDLGKYLTPQEIAIKLIQTAYAFSYWTLQGEWECLSVKYVIIEIKSLHEFLFPMYFLFRMSINCLASRKRCWKVLQLARTVCWGMSFSIYSPNVFLKSPQSVLWYTPVYPACRFNSDEETGHSFDKIKFGKLSLHQAYVNYLWWNGTE